MNNIFCERISLWSNTLFNNVTLHRSAKSPFYVFEVFFDTLSPETSKLFSLSRKFFQHTVWSGKSRKWSLAELKTKNYFKNKLYFINFLRSPKLTQKQKLFNVFTFSRNFIYKFFVLHNLWLFSMQQPQPVMKSK